LDTSIELIEDSSLKHLALVEYCTPPRGVPKRTAEYYLCDGSSTALLSVAIIVPTIEKPPLLRNIIKL